MSSGLLFEDPKDNIFEDFSFSLGGFGHVAKLADALALGASGVTHGGSSPPLPTLFKRTRKVGPVRPHTGKSKKIFLAGWRPNIVVLGTERPTTITNDDR
jgi:hypothetical protein